MASRFLLFHCFYFGCVADVLSQNCGFLPGDAFFSAIINEETVFEDGNGKLHFTEAGTSIDGSLGGFIGFHSIVIECDAKSIEKRIRVGMKRVRDGLPGFERVLTVRQDSDGKTNSRWLSSFVAMIYRIDFDCTTLPIGLRFNEKWVDDKDDSTMPHARSRYKCEWATRDAFEFDTLFAKKVNGIDVEFNKEIDWRKDGPKSSEYLHANLDRCKIVIVPETFFSGMTFSEYAESLNGSVEILRMGLKREDLTESEIESTFATWAEISVNGVSTFTIGDGPLRVIAE